MTPQSPLPVCSSLPLRPERPILLSQRIEAGVLTPRCVLDVVYHPWPTRLAVAATRSGAAVAGGFALLLHQEKGTGSSS